MDRLFEARRGRFDMDAFISPSEQARAHRKCDDLATTKDGQKEILSRARRGDRDCIHYLFLRAEPILGNMFIHFYIGHGTEAKRRIEDNAYEDFGSLAYQVLAASSVRDEDGINQGKVEYSDLGVPGNGPLSLFKPEIFDKDPDVDLINKFNYFYQSILRNTIISERRKARTKGLGGKITKRDTGTSGIRMVAVDDTTQSAFSTDPDTAFDEAFPDAGKASIRDWINFVKTPALYKGNYPTMIDVLRDGLLAGKNFTMKDYIEQTGVTRGTILARLKDLGILFERRGLSAESLNDLVERYGTERLASYIRVNTSSGQ